MNNRTIVDEIAGPTAFEPAPTNTATRKDSPTAEFERFVSLPVYKFGDDYSGQWLDSREIWACRELLYFLAWRDIQVRYKQTLLIGVASAFIQPDVTVVVFTIAFSRMVNVPSDRI